MTKYHAVRTTVDNITFASKKEATRYGELKLLLHANQINNLELQPKYPFIFEGETIFTYRGDFSYFENHAAVVEDVKGFKTPVYRLKKKLIEAQYKIQIREM